MSSIEDLYENVQKSLRVVIDLQRKVNELKAVIMDNGEPQRDISSGDPVVVKNVKLKHRLNVLQSAVDEEKKRHKKVRMDSCKSKFEISDNAGLYDLLTNIFTLALSNAFPDVTDYGTVIMPSTRPIFGDFQCNSAMTIARDMKKSGSKISPFDVANKIVENIPENEVIEKVESVKNGFVNIWLSKKLCEKRLTQLLVEGVQPPFVSEKKRVLIDFSSPNIAKEMHVGHLRSTIIGDSIARLLEFLGHDVIRINHVGDWGTQFGMLIAHLQDEFPNFATESPPISDLQSFYKQSKKRFDEDPEFKKRAYECVVKLQSFEPTYIKAWNLICEVSRKEFKILYDKLGVVITERGESFYQKMMEELVKELDSKGVLEEDEGRKVLFGLEKGQIPMTIVKSDGGFTYDTSDLAAVRYRIEQDKASWIIVVTDAGQATHFKVLYSCAQRLGILDPSKVRTDHVCFGVVLGEDKKKFKTRSGDTVRLNDLLEEGVRRAEEKLKEKNRHIVLTPEELELAKEAVAYGCIKYADLSHNRINDYVFSFDKMLEDKGNTAVYLLYALTRIRSIARNAGVLEDQLTAYAETNSFSLDHEKELKLAKVLLKFNDVLTKITQDLLLHHLCEFLYEVATTFTEFYDACYCIEKGPDGDIIKINMGRLLLCEATAKIMEKCFSILGIKTVSKM